MIRKDTIPVVFDLDGTLIDSAPGILKAFSSALSEAGIDPQIPLDSSLIGPPLTETLIRLCGSDESQLILSLSAKFKKHYDSTGVAATLPYPGVEQMLKRFSAAGYALHLCTNKRHSITLSILDHLGWGKAFRSVYALDMVEPHLPGKPQLLLLQIAEQQLSASTVIYIGDKHEDGLAADFNEIRFYYASWGYGQLQPKQINSHWTWLNHPDELCIGTSILVPLDQTVEQ